jgi:inner membrane protein
MDNITHTLIGLAAAEGVASGRKKARLPLWIASGVANNLPDLDVIETSVIFRDPLSYLLHHRGHTHTFLLAPLQSLLWLGCLWLLWRKREDMPWKEISFLVFLGVPLHIFADFWNSYGVHPFWPWDNAWIYGDMVFIVEPWIWVLFLPPLAAAAATKLGKRICYGLLSAILLLSCFHSAVPWEMALLLGLGTIFSFLIAQLSPTARIFLPITLFVCALLGMKFTSEQLRSKHSSPPALLALSPFPANPFCWVAIETKLEAERYQAKLSTLAAFPDIYPAEKCPSLHGKESTAPLKTSASGDRIFESSKSALDQISKDCVGEAFLRFARAPFWLEKEGKWIIGDLRFDRGPELGFSEFTLGGATCPSSLPPWTGPYHPSRL